MSNLRHPSVCCAKSLAIFVAIALPLFLPSSTVLAQETTGAIQGTVSAPDGTPLSGAEVAATKAASRVERVTITIGEGLFRLVALPLGEYEVTIRHPKYPPATVSRVTVRLGATTAVPPVRLAAAGTLVERVEVVGKAPRIDPVSTTAGGSLASDTFDRLPLQRDYQSIATLLPGVSVSYLGDPVNFAGATGFENRYFVDGAEITDPGRGMGGAMLPPDFIGEVEVKTGGYEAEYRSALGGIVNVVTPTGGNEISGKLIGYWTSHVVSQDPKLSPLQLQQRDYAQYDAGFCVSGPVVKDRAWFFLAYDPQRQTVETELPGVGYIRDSSTTQRFAGKIDWRPDAANSLTLTVVGDPQRRDAVGEMPFDFGSDPVSFLNPDPYLRRIETGGVGASLRATHVPDPRVLLESSFSYFRRKDHNLPRTERGREEQMFVDATTGVWSGGSTVFTAWSNDLTTVELKATWMAGAHEMKGGLDYRDNKETIDEWGDDVVTKFADDSFGVSAQVIRGEFHNRVSSAFAQDSWRIGPRWVLNYGIRWAREDFVASTGKVAQTIDGEWQPRVGFVYQPGGVGTQRVFGSAARYYQELSSHALYLYAGTEGFWRFCNYDHDPRVDPGGAECIEPPVGIQPEVPGLRGAYTDEYSLGYQRRLSERHTLGVRGTYRTLGDTIEDGFVTANESFAWGNPGRGLLAADYPRASRVYRALELTIDGHPNSRSGYLASYVLAENRGNYPGFYNTDWGFAWPNMNGSFDTPDGLINGDGPLPNDRTHVLKGSGFYGFRSGFNVGASALWQSGTPLSEFGGSAYGQPAFTFLRPRGTAGRTSSIFDLSLRADYTFRQKSPGRWKPRLILDVYHLFSGRKPVDFDQVHYFNVDADGNQIDPNPTYGTARKYYPPTTARLGLEVSF
jgi:hypothetical protein